MAKRKKVQEEQTSHLFPMKRSFGKLRINCNEASWKNGEIAEFCLAKNNTVIELVDGRVGQQFVNFEDEWSQMADAGLSLPQILKEVGMIEAPRFYFLEEEVK